MIDAFFAFLLEEDFGRAIKIFGKLADEYPDDPYLLSYLGLRYYRNLGRPKEAAELFEKALERDSGFVQAYNWLGYIAMDLGDQAAAEETFKRYISLAPDQPRPYNSLGVLYLRQARYEDAARQFELACAQDARFTESRDNLARAGITPINKRLAEAVRQRDAAAVAELYTEDAQLSRPGSASITGQEAIARYFQGAFGAGFNAAEAETLEVYSGGDSEFATEVGSYRGAAGNFEEDTGSYMVVWHRTPEGWKRHRDISTADGGFAG